MNITGVPLADFYAITDDVSRRAYDGNVAVAPDAHNARGNSITARLRVRDGRGAGARTAASGRHGPYACWHAYRDVLWTVFSAYPDARARTALETYQGISGFERDFPATRYRNIGSVMYPAYMPDLCVVDDCGEAGPPFLRTVDDLAAVEESACVSDDDRVLARIQRELQRADRYGPEPIVFEGPPSLAGVPDLAYSGR
ncbi:hypothetical protein AB0I98_35500 [Streptomyces sp. NPDC050211]|uniref:hypothetical protein n=1 Tax=Streptomyces sp. NPDC050211 TaxID=3154932 RepID=UPI0034355503